MVLYYLLALSTGMVKKVYWHQLVATGYGLIDERDGKKYPAFEAFITMTKLINKARLIKYDFSGEVKYMKFEKDEIIEIFWSKSGGFQKRELGKMFNIYGKKYTDENFMYAIEEKR
jgi:hypothetical protein